ncbi:WXG100 family type VII secretion target [Nonomuraea sp. NPDC004297]
MSGEQETVVIVTGSSPTGEWLDKTKDEIKALLQDTDAFIVDGTGQTYQNAASKIEQAIAALEEHAPKIADVWKGPDATVARAALELLHASGTELSGKLSMMGQALQTYASHLTDTEGKVDEAVTVPGGTYTTEAERDLVKKSLENTHAQRALYELNQKIVDIYDVELPQSVTFELPTVTPPTTPSDTDPVRYPTDYGADGAGYDTSGSGTGGYGGGSGSAAHASTGGSSSTGSGSGGSDGPGSTGSNPGGSNQGGTDPNGSDPNGSDPTAPGSDTPADPALDTPTTPDPAQTPGTGDDAVPPVIGADGRTTTDGPNSLDPNRADLASFQPTTTATIGSTFTTPTTTMNPTSGFVPSPTGGTPGMPSVIGSPGVGVGQAGMVPPGARGAGAMHGGAPFMPFMGGGGGAGGHSDLERETYMPEDKSAWSMGHETTEPVIG